MDNKGYTRLLGQLVADLQALEYVIRAYLYARADGPHKPFASDDALDLIKFGDLVPENAMTDYSTLGQLIDRFNRLVANSHPELRLDSSIVSVRDALAHGRVSTGDPSRDLVLVKFGKPRNGLARVEYVQTLTAGWLLGQADRVGEEFEKIAKAPGTRLVAV